MKQHQAERLRNVIAGTGATVEAGRPELQDPRWTNFPQEWIVKVGNMVIVTEKEYAMALLAVAERMER